MTESPFFRTGGELRLSNPGQSELLRAAVERGAALRMPVRGTSMAPFIRDRDVLTVAPLNGRASRVGDVVAFAHPTTGRLAVHRAIARVGEGWLIRGDNCTEADGVVPREYILGRVVRVERNGRGVRLGMGAEARLIAWLQRRVGLWRLRAWSRLPRRMAGGGLWRLGGQKNPPLDLVLQIISPPSMGGDKGEGDQVIK